MATVQIDLDLAGQRETHRGLRDLSGDLDRVERSSRTAETRGLAKFRRGLDATARKGGPVGRMLGGMGRAFRSFGRAAAVGVGVAVAALAALGTALVASSVRSGEQLKTIRSVTDQIIRSTGGAARVTTDQVNAMNRSLQNLTGVDDKVIQAGSNILLTFKNIRNEAGAGNDIFTRANAIMLDLAQVTGTDATSSATMLGKALEDPVRGLTAMRRVGVSFTAQQEEQVKAMAAAGDQVAAQRLILDELGTQYGGAAAAAADATALIGQRWEDLKERLGVAVLPVISTIADAFGSWSDRNDESMDAFFAGVQEAAGGLGTLVADALRGDGGWGDVLGFFGQVGALAGRVMVGALAAVDWGMVGRSIASGVWDGIKSSVSNLVFDEGGLIGRNADGGVRVGRGSESGGSFGGGGFFDEGAFTASLESAAAAFGGYVDSVDARHNQSIRDRNRALSGWERTHNRTVDRLQTEVRVDLETDRFYRELSRLKSTYVSTLESIGLSRAQVVSLDRRDRALASRSRAVGGTVTPGVYRVGERGPEVVRIPAIGQVDRNDEVRRGGDGGTVGRPIEIPVVVDGREVARAAVEGIRALDARR